MILNQGPHSRLDDIVAAAPIGEDSELIVQVRRPIHADRNANAIFGKKLNSGGRQQCGIRGHAEVDGTALSRSAISGVGHYLLEEREIHQRFAPKESDVHAASSSRLVQ